MVLLTISYYFQIENAKENEPFKLDCILRNMAPIYNIQWYKVYDEKNVTVVDSPRLVTDSEGSLWFLNVQKLDATKDFWYRCSELVDVKNIILVGHKVLLNVINSESSSQANDLKLLHSSNVTTGLIGKRVKLFCIFGGNPAPNVTWMKGNENLDQTGNILSITKAKHEDAGNYTCHVSNQNGSKKSHTITLTVKEVPFFLTEPKNSYYETIGNDVNFYCEAQGTPKPKITWTFNGEPYNGTEIKNLEVSSNNVFNQSFTIKNIEEKNMGNYGCLAKNDVGYVYKDFFLNVLEVEPEITKKSSNTIVREGDKLYLFCKACGVPKPEVKWDKSGTTSSFGNEVSIKNVKLSDSGEYVCVAANKLGTSNWTLTVDVEPIVVASNGEDLVNEKSNNVTYIIVLFFIVMLIVVAFLITFVERHSNDEENLSEDIEAHNMEDISSIKNHENEKIQENQNVAEDQKEQKIEETQNETKEPKTDIEENVNQTKDNSNEKQLQKENEIINPEEAKLEELKHEEVKSKEPTENSNKEEREEIQKKEE